MSDAYTPSGPFVTGKTYRVLQTFKALRDQFEAGELLVYKNSAWSRYDGITGYFFNTKGKDEGRMWDIYDEVSVFSEWTKYFAEVPEAEIEVKA